MNRVAKPDSEETDPRDKVDKAFSVLIMQARRNMERLEDSRSLSANPGYDSKKQ